MEDRTQSEPVTKADLTNGLSSLKTELTETITRLAVEVTKTQADVRQIKEDMATKVSTKDDISRVMSAIDAFAAEALSYRNHDTLRGRAIMDHDSKLKDHENRIILLETPK